MKTMAISELKAYLSEYVNLVKSADEAVVTERGKQRSRGPFSGLKKEELITFGSGKLPNDFWALPRAEEPQGLVLKALLEERESGR